MAGAKNSVRFVVGDPNGVRSSSWKLWIQGAETYLVQRAAGAPSKFSFHSSGMCRWAGITARPDGADRLFHRWKRSQIPQAGSGKGAVLLSLILPTNLLSEPYVKLGQVSGDVLWIKPAPAGRAVRIDIAITAESRDAIDKLAAEPTNRSLIFCGKTRHGEHVCAWTYSLECGPISLRVPARPRLAGQVFGDLVYSDADDGGTGRPVRMLMIPREENPPVMWELGGYEANKLSVV